jgi:hypothetical protein
MEFTQCATLLPGRNMRNLRLPPPLWGRVGVGGEVLPVTPTLALPHRGGGKRVAPSHEPTLGELHTILESMRDPVFRPLRPRQ